MDEIIPKFETEVEQMQTENYQKTEMVAKGVCTNKIIGFGNTM